LPLSGLILAMAGDPDSMRHAAADWRGDQPADAPGSAAVVNDIRTDLARMKREIKDDDHWTGASYQMFSDKVDDFNDMLREFMGRRQGVADSLDAAAGIYTAACRLSLAAAGIVGTLAALSKIFATTNRLLWLTTMYPQIVLIVNGVTRGVGAAVKTQSKVILKAALILTGAGYLFSQMSSRLPGMQPVKMDVPDFGRTKLAFDPTTGGLTQSVDLQDMGSMKQSSMLPGLV
ncbi:MAG TPA: hypothetical protein VIR33_01520, partial [Thermopolyspora sp.]